MSRTCKRLDDYYPEPVEALVAQEADDFVVDGEVVAFEGRRSASPAAGGGSFRGPGGGKCAHEVRSPLDGWCSRVPRGGGWLGWLGTDRGRLREDADGCAGSFRLVAA
jgi:hypothetical protein